MTNSERRKQKERLKNYRLKKKAEGIIITSFMLPIVLVPLVKQYIKEQMGIWKHQTPNVPIA